MAPTLTATVSAPAAAPRDVYPAALTLAEARALYFRQNHFGEDGGYSDAWVDFKLGPIPMPFPNTKGRVRAVRYHDLHHIVTGYRTDFTGELEISAWELATGCADLYAAWALNLGGLAAGALVAPQRTWRAFVRGRRSRNLYRHRFDDALLGRRVGEVRKALGLEEEAGPSQRGDGLAFAGYLVAGLVTGLALFAVALPLMPFGLLANLARR